MFCRRSGHRPVGAIVRADCRELVAGLRGKGLKLNIVRGIARTLSALLSQAVEDEKLPANPALRMGKYLRRGDEPEQSIQALTATEVAHLVAIAERHLCAGIRGSYARSEPACGWVS
jgi:hypothetical protein